MQDLDTILFPAITPHRSGMLPVDALHTLYWEECGNPEGLPVVFLHGGPGAGLSPQHRRFFDPQRYRIILFEQRGAGRSTPLGETRDNTTAHLVEDIERLRNFMGVERWLVFGGSWGSTLALAYGQAHASRCLGFVLRGVFLCTPAELDWFMHGIRWFFPEAHAEFVQTLPEAERSNLLAAFSQRMFGTDRAASRAAAIAWSRYESRCLRLLPSTEPANTSDAMDDAAFATGKLEAHYFLHQGFLQEDQLLRGVDTIRHLPCVIVQGRYDVICPPATAWRLQQAWPQARLHMVADAGHSALEPGTAQALVEATNAFAALR